MRIALAAKPRRSALISWRPFEHFSLLPPGKKTTPLSVDGRKVAERGAACEIESEAARLRYGEEKAKREVAPHLVPIRENRREEEGCQHPHLADAQPIGGPDARSREGR